MHFEAGDRFHVTEAFEARSERGNVLAVYRPKNTYPVTMLNAEHVRMAAGKGIVVKGPVPGTESGLSVGKVQGQVAVVEKKGGEQ